MCYILIGSTEVSKQLSPAIPVQQVGRNPQGFAPLHILRLLGFTVNAMLLGACGYRRLVLGVATFVLLLAPVSLSACGKPHNPPLGPKPTAPLNAGPATASNGETPEQAAVRLFPSARADLESRGVSPQRLEEAGPGPVVPVSADYPSGAALAQWVLPDDAKSVSGNMFTAMWPSAMAKDIFVVPIVDRSRSVGQFIVNLQKGAWVYWS